MTAARIVMPAAAKAGEVIEIKCLIQHVMETGHRRDPRGNKITRDIINQFVVTYAGREIFRADLFPGIAANPFFAFTTTASTSGPVVFQWTGDSGFTARESRDLVVSG